MNVKKISKLLPLVLSGVLMCGTASAPLTASAGEPYDVYNYDRWGEAIPSQAGYTAERSVSGIDLGIGHMKSPSDIFCDADHNFYITDSDNNRIIVVDSEFTRVIKTYYGFRMPNGTETKLSKPMGIYVSPVNGYIYVADNKNSRVLIADKDGNFVSEITKPDSEIYGSSRTFLPQRVLADKAGNVYVVLNNITTGAAMFSPDGEFTGFYGANRVEPTAEIVRNYIFNLFASEEKKAHKARNVPSGITSFDIDGDFIFTCSESGTQTTDTVKKLNAAGNNIFANLQLEFGDRVPMYDSAQNKLMRTAIVDIDIAEDGNINCLDYTTGRVFQYDEDCNLLFITGTKAKQLGGFEAATAVESCGDSLYVLDSSKNTVTIFKETSFGEIVHTANKLYNEGRYEEALEPWYEVLKRDGNYRRANKGVALALLRKGDYKGAMKYAKLAEAPNIYNKAFEGYRREFLKAHFSQIAAASAAVIALLLILSRKRNKKRASAAASAAKRLEEDDQELKKKEEG